MSYFIKNGSRFDVSDSANIDIRDSLPVGNYTVKYCEMSRKFYLDSVDSFSDLGKLYGDVQKRADRVLTTFLSRSVSTGVLLSGEKGSGKTMLARKICIDLAKQGTPTIIINSAFCGDEFNQFIQRIDQPAIIMFDEFEKVYDREDQEKILTLLDGVYPTKKLFVLTCNDKYRVDSHMRNRPGRIYYSIEFEGLDRAFVQEYCEDNLINKDNIQGVISLSGLFTNFNFDMLKALVEEMNRFNETAAEAVQMLNAKPTTEDSGSYRIEARDSSGKTVPLSNASWHGNPLRTSVFNMWTDFTDSDDDYSIDFDLSCIVNADAIEGSMTFVAKDGHVIKFIREVSAKFDFMAF